MGSGECRHTGGALRLLAVLAVGFALAPAFFAAGAFLVAASLVAFLGAPTFFLGATSLAAASFFVVVFYVGVNKGFLTDFMILQVHVPLRQRAS